MATLPLVIGSLIQDSSSTINYVRPQVAYAQVETVRPATSTPAVVTSGIACSCVEFAHSLGVPFPRVADARQVLANSTPQVGGLVLFHYPSGVDHVAVITGFSESGDIIVREANYHHCQIDTRIVRTSDTSIRGFWSAN